MRVIYQQRELVDYLNQAKEISLDQPLLLDQFLDDAIEVDIDAVCDGESVLVGGILEHIEQAGVHSGDSSCVLPPHSLTAEQQQELCRQVELMALELGVVGLINIQFALKGDDVFVLEVNPRASRTVPFIAKATGVSLAKIAARCMAGQSLIDQAVSPVKLSAYYAVKKPVFPFAKFPPTDPILGPEMRSTGEVMGVGLCHGEAFAQAQLAIGQCLPTCGVAFLSVRDNDKPKLKALASSLIDQGFTLIATRGTAASLQLHNIPCDIVNKMDEGRPHIVDKIKNQEVQFIVNTTEGQQAVNDSAAIRSSAIQYNVCYTTTLAGGMAACMALQQGPSSAVRSLQDLHALC